MGGSGNPHRTRVRKLGALMVVDLDIEVDPAMSVSKGHDIAVRVEAGERYSLRPAEHEASSGK